MTIEELKTLFSDMLSKDMNPMLCDTEVPLYDASVPCGEPNYSPDEFVETVLLPKELLSMHPEFMLTVKGESMKDAGIETGDVVKVTDNLNSDSLSGLLHQMFYEWRPIIVVLPLFCCRLQLKALEIPSHYPD